MKKDQKLITRFFNLKEGEQKKLVEGSTQASIQNNTQTEEEKSKQKPDTEYKFDRKEFFENFRDGRRIYHNRLKFYEEYRPDMIRFIDLLDEYLNIPDIKETKIEELKGNTPENIIFTTFVSEDSYIAKTIIAHKIECTMFKHGYKTATVPVEAGKSVLDFPEIKMRWILPDLKGKFTVFHPKVILIKFPHLLRVVVTTSNFIESDWEKLGQLIWFQDFKYVTEPVECKFKNDLMKFFQDIMPEETTIAVK